MNNYLKYGFVITSVCVSLILLFRIVNPLIEPLIWIAFLFLLAYSIFHIFISSQALRILGKGRGELTEDGFIMESDDTVIEVSKNDANGEILQYFLVSFSISAWLFLNEYVWYSIGLMISSIMMISITFWLDCVVEVVEDTFVGKFDKNERN